jgi:hypothetical protein
MKYPAVSFDVAGITENQPSGTIAFFASSFRESITTIHLGLFFRLLP